MSLIVEFVMALLFGFVLFLLAPILTRGYLSGWFFEMAQSAMDKAVLVMRSSGPQLKSVRFDEKSNSWTCKIGGEKRDFEDTAGLMTRLHKRPFGIALPEPGVIVNPAVADIALRVAELRRRGELEDDKGRKRQWVALEPGETLVDITGSEFVVQGSGSSLLPNVIRDFRRKSQAIFNSGRAITYTIWLMSFAVGAGGVYLLAELGSNIEGDAIDGVSIPIGTLIDVMGALG